MITVTLKKKNRMMIIPIKKEEEKVQRDAVEWALAVQR